MRHPMHTNALETLAELVADRVLARLSDEAKRVLVTRDELAELTSLGVRTIDRMAKGGSWERDKTGQRVWKPTDVTLRPVRHGGRVMFDKSEALSALGRR